MALIEFNNDVGGRHPWEVLNTQRSEVKTPYCKVVVYSKHILLFNKKQLDRTQVSQLRNVFSNTYMN